MCEYCGTENPIYMEFVTPFQNNLQMEIYKKILYISEDILHFELDANETEVLGITLFLKNGANIQQILKHLEFVVKRDIIGLKNIEIKRVWDFDNMQAGQSKNILDELIHRGYVHIHGEGQVSIKEPFIALFELFDRLFEGVSRHVFGAENYRFPTLLQTSVLKKVGYFDSFPNLLMFAVRLKNTVDNFDEFRKEFEDAKSVEDVSQRLLKYVCETNYSLPPTMCYYVYSMFENSEFTENKAVTARGKSFRFENQYHKPLQRLWDFTIRETVFLGDYEYVRRSIEEYRKVATILMEAIGLRGFCETATDPFFLVDDTAKRVNIQKMLGSKYELQLRLNQEETIAVGSFNFHNQFLSQKFRLYKNRAEDQYIYTGCIGIGLERMFFAFLSQYGIDSNGWPDIVKEGINQEKKATHFFNNELSKILNRQKETK
ncbi:hypothetical protein WJ0W_006735 [Paenibacillus melissococcoides]|uniref:Aminoacyl-transfer RNA synthetases class-II family profile domain-containing protein n=1 Tax=Paenibacillus melissococcoides TaxID=2912268 RepID=A0ABN8UI04_9BACL|nr:MULTISPECIES: aminoacyl--tRNA ligase-related protein [Paenibacillus]MEB9895028.1 hypothetical protein [Bacillus cereus]GIO79025.1 hypothetical protein J6TS7_26350 [Paenibacillus dendritiformis]CAH8249550.1 hypothetical protein WJ0W_006735 [Paenibacillus melissococcoides]CAH8721089.1 hypothetical protein HTL2_006184 [Paenibacillus melissococcoides]